MKTRTLAAFVAAAIAVAGCTVGPDYVRPSLDTPAAWRIDYPKAAEVANTKWWEQFGDPVLNDLIETALRENRDIRIAAARVEQFEGALMSTRSQARTRAARRRPAWGSRRSPTAWTGSSRCTRVRWARRGRWISSAECGA